MTIKRALVLNWLDDDEFNWRATVELLKREQYDQVAEFLEQARIMSEQTDNIILAEILAAARQICLACTQCHAGATWHQHAYEEVSQLEYEFKQILENILDTIRQYAALDTDEPVPSQKPSEDRLALLGHDIIGSAERPGLLQRIQSLLGWGQSSRPLKQKEPVEFPEEAEVPVSLPNDVVEISSSSSAREVETPVEQPLEKAEGSMQPSPEQFEVLALPPAKDVEMSMSLPAEQIETEAPPTEKVEALAPTSAEEAEMPGTLPAEEDEVPAASPAEMGEQALPSLVIYCLGPFRVYQNDQLITEWNSLKGQSIFKYLVTQKGRPIAKDILMDVFWPDAEPGDTRRNLHQAIYSLRQTLRRGMPDLKPIQFRKDCYLFNPEIILWLDFEEFEKHVLAGQRLEAAGQLAEAMAEYSIAEGLYQGDFLEENLYEDWPSVQREHLRRLYLQIVDRLSEHYLQQGEYAAAIALCQKILAKDNCYEAAYCRLMQCHLAQGQRPLAVRQYQTCAQALAEELNLTPSEETVGLYRSISSEK